MTPAALCRLDADLIERLRNQRGLALVARRAVLTVVVGGASYGVAFGLWRAPAQALCSAVKIPVLFLAVTACSVPLGAMLAALVRSRLTFLQTAVCMLLSFAVSSAVLGGVAPVSIAFDLLVPPRAASVGHALLLLHTFALAVAGMLGVTRLRELLARLGLGREVSRRLVVSWMTTQFLVGSQLCWLLRPFLGDPNVPVTLFPADLHGNFFDTVGVLVSGTFGRAAPIAWTVTIVGAAVLLVTSLRTEAKVVSVEVSPGGLRATDAVAPSSRSKVFGWRDVTGVRVVGASVLVDTWDGAALVRETLTVPCPGEEAALDLLRLLNAARSAAGGRGPFR